MKRIPQWFINVLILGIFAYWGSTYFERYFLLRNWVNISDVSLGTLHPGSTIEFPVTVYNSGPRGVALRPIQTSCGCLAPDRDKPIVLYPGKNVLNFAFTAPNSLGEVDQDIWFFAEKGKPSVWTVQVDGVVAANAWVTPSSLTLRYDDSLRYPGGTFVLNFIDRNVQSITTTPVALECHFVRGGENQYTYSVTCNGKLSDEVLEKGRVTGSVLFEFEETDQESLEVQIDLVAKPKFRVIPARMDLPLSSLSEKTLSRTVAVQKLADLSFDHLQVIPVGDYARLVDMRDGGNYIFLTFEFLLDRMPTYESTIYARLTFSDLPEHYQIECRFLLR